ncbi:hypothetical protein D3C73_1519990 [compost metagenome]
MAVSNSVTCASLGTEVSKGHQNSTASKPAAFAAAGRSSKGSSVRRMEQFTVYVIVGPSEEGLGSIFLLLGCRLGVWLQFPLCGI